MKNITFKRILAFALAMVLCLGAVPAIAPAASAATSSSVASAVSSRLPLVTYAMPLSGASRVYSYSDAESLLRSLPLVAVYGAVLLFAVVVWAGTCYLTRIQQSRWLLWANAGCGVLTLGAVLRLGRAIDLPASLMPPESILDFSHYQKEFSNIFAAMEEVGDTSLQTLSTKCCAAALAVLLAGALLGAAILLIEGILLKRKKNA